MQVFIGLGNPGDEYAHTRHNAGFETIDLLAETAGVTYWKTACGCLLGTGKIRLGNGSVEEVLLAKPQSYMNLSGGPVSRICKEYQQDPTDLVVIHDELDIDPGTVRIKKGGGHAGHNGLRSIIDKCGTRDFTRIRVGIGRPPGRMKVPDFVLSVPKKQDLEDFQQACSLAHDAAISYLEVGLNKTQSKFNAS